MIKFFLEGKEVKVSNEVIKIDDKIDIGTNSNRWSFNKTFEVTLTDAEISEEFSQFLEKQRKLLKMQKARERLYRDIE